VAKNAGSWPAVSVDGDLLQAGGGVRTEGENTDGNLSRRRVRAAWSLDRGSRGHSIKASL